MPPSFRRQLQLGRLVRTFALLGAGLLVVVIVVVAIGYALPVKHTATRERTYTASPRHVFATITTPQEFPQWRSGVKSVEVLSDAGGRHSFREVSGDGTITYVVEESIPELRLVTRIADTGLPFGGQWTYQLTPTPQGGTTLRITEDGEVYNPVFRFMSRFVFGHHRTIETYLSDLDRVVASVPTR